VTGRHQPAAEAGRAAAVIARRRPATTAAVIAAVLLTSAVVLAACSGGSGRNPAKGVGASLLPQRIIPAPRALLSATRPQPNGTLWAVAGSSSVGLFKLDTGTGRQFASTSVSKAARSVAQNSGGIVAIALATQRAGALELLRNGTPKKTVGLPAPAQQVVAASSGSNFYVLTAWPGSASISTVSPAGRLLGTVPAPADSVSVAADPRQDVLYALQRDGVVDELDLHGGKIESSFTVDGDGMSIALSPDGSRLYVLKGTPSMPNIAVVDTATQGVLRVLPAPSHCIEVTVAPDGRHLYETVGSPDYGNIQVFGV
jgi:DNA-binding beta-propeller fold protein YncE